MNVFKNYCLLLSLFLGLSAFAGEYKVNPVTSSAIPNFMGKVVLVKGKAIKMQKGKSFEVRLTKGNKVYQGDIINTSKKTIVKLKMVDDSLLTIGPKSEMVFEKMDFVSKKKRTALYNILKGQVRANIKNKVKKPHKIIFNSPQASMGIRGTELLANVRTNDLNTSITQFALLSGEGEIKNNMNGDVKLLTPKKQFYMATKGNNIVAQDLLEISDDVFKKLTSSDNKLASNFPGLLDYYILDEEKEEARRLELERVKIQRKMEKEKMDDLERGHGWKDTLKNLNNKLDENRDN